VLNFIGILLKTFLLFQNLFVLGMGSFGHGNGILIYTTQGGVEIFVEKEGSHNLSTILGLDFVSLVRGNGHLHMCT